MQVIHRAASDEVRALVRAQAHRVGMPCPPIAISGSQTFDHFTPWMRTVMLSELDLANFTDAEREFHVLQQVVFVHSYWKRVLGALAGIAVVLGGLFALSFLAFPAWFGLSVLAAGAAVAGYFIHLIRLPYPDQIYDADARALRIAGNLGAAKGAIRKATCYPWHLAAGIADWIPSHAHHRIERLDP